MEKTLLSFNFLLSTPWIDLRCSGLFKVVIKFVQFRVSDSPESFYKPALEHQTWGEARVIDMPADHSYGISTGCQRRTLSQHAF